MAVVHFSKQAKKEYLSLPTHDRKRLRSAFEKLRGDARLDIAPLSNCRPWERLRVGDLRVILRMTTDGSYLVARIVHRQDLHMAIDRLPYP